MYGSEKVKALTYFYINQEETNAYFQFEIIIIVIYGLYKCFNLSVRGSALDVRI